MLGATRLSCCGDSSLVSRSLCHRQLLCRVVNGLWCRDDEGTTRRRVGRPPRRQPVRLGSYDHWAVWNCVVRRSRDASCFHVSSCLFSEGGFFNARLKFPEDFPNHPPEMTFTTEMWHPNSSYCGCTMRCGLARCSVPDIGFAGSLSGRKSVHFHPAPAWRRQIQRART